MKIKIQKSYKSILSPMEFELPRFTVITGENGSGKTHLFEAIADRNNGQVFFNGKQLETISYIPFGALNPQVDQSCDPSTIAQKVKDLWQNVQNVQRSKPNTAKATASSTAIENDPIIRGIGNQQYKKALIRISRNSGIEPLQLTEDIIADNISMVDLSNKGLFNTQFALIFKSYHVRDLDNKLNRVYEDEGMFDSPRFIDNTEFKSRYGEAPWVFVNSILERLKLPYEVNNPLGTKRDSTFDFKLIHKVSKIEINTNDLSSGEKSLMSLALAMYNSTGVGDRADILILDEPDAPLHPSMSKLMLDIIEQEIVRKHDIPVIISTHSPTTIACTPGNSLYKISSQDKNPVQCDL